jgi:hypothetical protein
MSTSCRPFPLSQQQPIPCYLSSPPLLSDLQSEATYHKNNVFYDVIKEFSIKDKRRLFAQMKNSDLLIEVDTFFPHYGFTCGEFSTWALITERNKKKAKKSK